MRSNRWMVGSVVASSVRQRLLRNFGRSLDLRWLFGPLAIASVSLATAFPARAEKGDGAAEPASSASTTPSPEPTPAPAPAPTPAPTEAKETPSDTGSLTGTPKPTAVESKGDDWAFSFHGYFRAPLRLGIGDRDSPGAGQSKTDFHSPRVPDDQYLSWLYTRQWEKDWTELFFNYGNKHIIGSVSIQAYNLTDASFQNTAGNTGAQYGIAQAFVTFLPSLPVAGLRLDAKVGSFWNKYGMSGKYDAGKYDVYLFGRTHSYGEVLEAEYDIGPVTLKASHGLGLRPAQTTLGNPTAVGDAGLTLLHHFHLGATIAKILDVNFHYLNEWSQDGLSIGAGTPAPPATPTPCKVPDPAPAGAVPVGSGLGGPCDGRLTVVGGEIRLRGNWAGELYAGYSKVTSVNGTNLGPVIEVAHSLGGTNYGLGFVDQYLGDPTKSNGNGSLDTFLFQYDLSLGHLYRKFIENASGFWGAGMDLTVSLFGMYSTVASDDKSMIIDGSRDPCVPATGAPGCHKQWDGIKKLKFGVDTLFTPLPWFGVGIRVDKVNPDSADPSQSFTVIAPKLVFKTTWLTHEEVTVQYARYSYAYGVVPQAPYQDPSKPGSGKPDKDVFGIKATMWW